MSTSALSPIGTNTFPQFAHCLTNIYSLNESVISRTLKINIISTRNMSRYSIFHITGKEEFIIIIIVIIIGSYIPGSFLGLRNHSQIMTISSQVYFDHQLLLELYQQIRQIHSFKLSFTYKFLGAGKPLSFAHSLTTEVYSSIENEPDQIYHLLQLKQDQVS